MTDLKVGDKVQIMTSGKDSLFDKSFSGVIGNIAKVVEIPNKEAMLDIITPRGHVACWESEIKKI